ncbi:MAG: GT4 family glycosyltransferase PelF [Sporomusaceae bacterium]|nr:GT4 family glycosyltransferase PelF [Sporomusaceae bacterium]
MRICMIVEGSYPYVTGGLSAWAQMLITGMPEHQFIIYSIAAEEKNRGKFRYQLPNNVIEVREIFLDSILNLNNPAIGGYKLSTDEIENLTALICGEGQIDLNRLLQTFRSGRSKTALDIFMSFDFFDVITKAYQQKFSQLPFTDFFWTVRSLLLPLFYIIQQELPEADVYHSVATGYAGMVGSLAATVYKKPFILTEHGIYSREREEEIIKSNWVKPGFKDLWITYFYSLAKLTYDKTDRVFSLFEQNALIQTYLGCDKEKISIIPNGIDVEKFGSIIAKNSSGQITVGALVRVVPIKDIITMLRSFLLVKQQLPSVKFVIAGPTDENPEYYEDCLNLIDSIGLRDVIFTGTVNVEDYLGDLDVLVLSSISEGQPLVILEGMAARKPFVATDVGSCRDLLYDNGDGFGESGYIVSVLDFEAMAGAIIKLAKNENLRKQMGENGYKRVASLYTRQGFLDSYRQVYAELGMS